MQQQDYTYTVITANRPIGKKFDAELEKTALPIFAGDVENAVGTLEEFADDLRAMGPNECITAGICRRESAQLTTKAREGGGRIARSNDHWMWPDVPGFMVIDHDREHWTQEPLESLEDVIKKVGELLDVDMSTVDYVALESSSSSIYLGDDQVAGFRGGHIYIGVTSMAQIDGDRLMDLAFERGLGCGIVSKSGSILKRSVFDAALMKAPSQPVYCGAVTFEGGHTSQRRMLVNHGAPLDMSLVLSVDTPNAAEAWRATRAALSSAADIALTKFVEDRKAAGLSEECVNSAVSGELQGSWPVTFNDWSTVTVADILREPGRYAGRADVRDPLEPEYGESKAIIFAEHGNVTIYSHAHGGRLYQCTMDLEAIAARLQELGGKDDWPQLVAALGPDFKPAEIVSVLRDNGVEIGKAELRDRVKRVQAQAKRDRAKEFGWAQQYVYLDEAGKFLNLYWLNEHKNIVTTPVFSFNIVHGNHQGPQGEAPAHWLVKEGHIPHYSRVVSKPADTLGDAVPIVENAYNVWRPGPALQPSSCEPQPWLELMARLFPNEKERQVIIQWLAYTIQYPGRKINWQLIIHGEEGIGKDTMLWPVRWAVGHHNAVDVASTELLSDFWQFLVNGPKLVVMQELDVSHKDAIKNRLKPLAAAPPEHHSVNTKNEKPVLVENTQSCIAFTNEWHPMHLDDGDRRWAMYSSPAPKMTTAEAKAIWQWYNTGGIRDVAQYLAGLDLEAFDPLVIPQASEYKKDVIDMSRTSYSMVIEEIVDGRAVVTSKWVQRKALAEYGEKITARQVFGTLCQMGWRPKVPTSSRGNDGERVSIRCFTSPGCTLVGTMLYTAAESLNEEIG